MDRSLSTFDSVLEKRVFKIIKELLPKGYTVQPQLPLSAFVDNWLMDELTRQEKWLIMSCSIDFTICRDDENLTPLIPLELDGYTNGESRGCSYFSLENNDEARKRKLKFSFKLRILRGLGFPLQVLPGDINWNSDSLRRKIWMLAYEYAPPNSSDPKNIYYQLALALVPGGFEIAANVEQNELNLIEKN